MISWAQSWRKQISESTWCSSGSLDYERGVAGSLDDGVLAMSELT